MESEIFLGIDFNLLSQLLSAGSDGTVDIKTNYYKILLVQPEVSIAQKTGKPEAKSSLFFFTPDSMGIKLLDLAAKKGYWCLISERRFIQYTLLKLITVRPLFSNDTDQISLEKSDHTFERLFKIMLRESASTDSHKYDAIFNCIALLLLEAIKRLPVNSSENEFNATVGLYHAFLYLLDERFKNPDCTTKLAMVEPCYFSALLSVDTDYLNKVVSELSGKNINELINEQVLRKANNLLSSSDSSLTEIAGLLGFDSPGQFQQLYKKSMGITPLTFRKNKSFYLPKSR